jgi:hypothetical protein
MRWFWAIALFSTLFWLRTLPVFTQAQEGWIWLIIAAIAAAAVGLRTTTVKEFDRRWLLLLIPLGIGLWRAPFPFDVPIVLLALAIVLMATMRFSRALAWVGLPLGLVGLILAVQAAFIPFLYVVASRVHEIAWLNPFFYALARLFDPAATLSDNQVIVHYVNEIFEFPTRLEALGFIPGGLIAMAGLGLLVAARRPLKVLFGFLIVIAGYSVLRYLFLVFMTVKLSNPNIFWFPQVTALSYVPLVIVLASVGWFNKAPRHDSFAVGWPGNRSVAVALVLVAIGVIGVTGFFAYHDPGVRKSGRVLIDEFHSDWEWTGERYDTEWYGRKSGYNYYCFAEYLKYYYLVEAGTDSLLPHMLSQYDIVVIKTPTSPYSEREKAALVKFVKDGGGLWLIGDHTNVFGTSTYLNQVAERFGLRFRYDSTYGLETMALSVFERPGIFPHPTVTWLPTFLFATSCTMESPVLSENMILGYGLRAMGIDYSETSFFPRKDSKNFGFGIFVQQGGVKYGKGRVAGFTDSTVFSNFFAFIPGKPELALATLEWLNRSNRFRWVPVVLLVCGLACLVGACAVLRKWGHSQGALLVLSAGFLGLSVAVMIYDGLVRSSYPLPEPHTDYVHVAFESEHSQFTLPVLELTKDPEISLHTFFVWTQRLGFFPSLEPDVETALAKGDLVVIAGPATTFEQTEIDAIVTYLSRGGRLLVLVDPANRTFGSLQLLGALGIRLPVPEPDEESSAPGDTLYIVNREGDRLVEAVRPGGLEGGTPLLGLSDRRIVLAEQTIGKGKALIFADFALFTNESMGHTGEMPDDRKHLISELEYWLLRDILDLPQPYPHPFALE